jgi:YD repeat-containing protein
MKSVLIGAVALMAILFSSCNKEISPVPTTGLHKKLVKTAYSGYYKDTTTYEYDQLGRLKNVNAWEDHYSFTYNGTNIQVKDFRPKENRTVYNGAGVLDASGRIKSISGDAAFAIDHPYSNTTTFLYDAQGFLQKRTDARNNGMTYTYIYTWANGDIVKVDCLENGTLLFYNVFEYFTTADLRGIDVWKFGSETTDLAGNNSRHLLKKTSSYSGTNVFGSSMEYTYTIDGQGYPSSGKLVSSFGDVSNVVYSYK